MSEPNPYLYRALDDAAALRADLARALDALYLAWTIIANAHGGDWSQAAPEWRAAAERWRDEQFHPILADLRPQDPQS